MKGTLEEGVLLAYDMGVTKLLPSFCKKRKSNKLEAVHESFRILGMSWLQSQLMPSFRHCEERFSGEKTSNNVQGVL